MLSCAISYVKSRTTRFTLEASNNNIFCQINVTVSLRLFLGHLLRFWAQFTAHVPRCRPNFTTYKQELEINKIIKYVWMYNFHWCKHATKSIIRFKNMSFFSPRLYCWRQSWHFRNRKCAYIAFLYQYSPRHFQEFVRYCHHSKHVYRLQPYIRM